jgi:hypothetical protein
MAIIHNCSFMELNTNDVILSHNDIVHLHTKVLAHWDHPRGNYLGPQVDRIMEKEFYDSLHKFLLIYLLPVMPFDCISLKMGFKVLCPPLLGFPHYAKIARVPMEILPRFLLRTDTHVALLIMMTCMESENGYNLLWQILVLMVLGFNPTIPVTIPVWQDDIIFEFATSFSYTSGFRPERGSSTMTAPIVLRS